MSPLSSIIAMVVALVCAAFFAGFESGLLNVSQPRLLGLVRQGKRNAARLAEVMEDLSRAMTTLLVGNNIANVVYSTASASLAVALAGGSGSMAGLCSLLSAVTMVFLGEYLPKLLFTTKPMRRCVAVTGVYRLSAFCLWPIVSVFSLFVRAVFSNRSGAVRRMRLSRDGLRRIVAEGQVTTRLSGFERILIERVLALEGRFASELMHAGEPPEETELRIPSNMRGDDILPVMRRGHQRTAVVYDADSLEDVGWITEEDILLSLTGVLKEG